MIEIRGLIKAFGSRPVLKGVNLEVNEGEFVTLVGPNGAGKTTLMNIIATLVKPTAGQIQVGGIDPGEFPIQVRRKIGMVSHKTLLYDDLNPWQNLKFFARMYDLTDPADRIEALLRQLGLWGRQHDPVWTLSRGMQQRLAIARALLHNPPILLLDEPDTGLDQQSAATLKDLLQLESKQRTVLMTTHNLERGLEWGDRIAILARMRIVYQTDRANLDAAGFREQYQRHTRGN